MFPKRQYAQSLEIFAAFESTKTHVQFTVTVTVVLFLNDMTFPFGFQPLAVVASLLDENQNEDYISNHNSNGKEFLFYRFNFNSQRFYLKAIAI